MTERRNNEGDAPKASDVALTWPTSCKVNLVDGKLVVERKTFSSEEEALATYRRAYASGLESLRRDSTLPTGVQSAMTEALSTRILRIDAMLGVQAPSEDKKS
jgi:hypothetical protein